jgi:2-methylaconitate cis-trans-isomerase PrpF
MRATALVGATPLLRVAAALVDAATLVLVAAALAGTAAKEAAAALVAEARAAVRLERMAASGRHAETRAHADETRDDRSKLTLHSAPQFILPKARTCSTSPRTCSLIVRDFQNASSGGYALTRCFSWDETRMRQIVHKRRAYGRASRRLLR